MLFNIPGSSWLQQCDKRRFLNVFEKNVGKRVCGPQESKSRMERFTLPATLLLLCHASLTYLQPSSSTSSLVTVIRHDLQILFESALIPLWTLNSRIYSLCVVPELNFMNNITYLVWNFYWCYFTRWNSSCCTLVFICDKNVFIETTEVDFDKS